MTGGFLFAPLFKSPTGLRLPFCQDGNGFVVPNLLDRHQTASLAIAIHYEKLIALLGTLTIQGYEHLIALHFAHFHGCCRQNKEAQTDEEESKLRKSHGDPLVASVGGGWMSMQIGTVNSQLRTC